MFPNRPVAIPDDPHNMQYPQIVSDPINAFSQGPQQFPQQLQQQFQQQYSPPQPPPSFGPNQQLAMQMAGYPGPSGIRSPMQMNVGAGAGVGGNAPGAYDGADPTRGGAVDMWLPNQGGKIGSGGAHPGTNQGWMDGLLTNALGHGYGPQGGNFDLGAMLQNVNLADAGSYAGKAMMLTGSPLAALAAGAYGLFNSSGGTPTGSFTPYTGPSLVESTFGLPNSNDKQAAPSGPTTEAPGTYEGHSMRQPIPIIQRRRPGTSNR
jgi:hypothetical protein